MKYKQICAIKSIVALIVFTSCILFFSTTLVSGAGEIPDEAKLEVIQFNAKQGINELVDYIIKWAFRLAGVLAFAMIVYAGFQYLTSGGNTAQQKDAQERIMNAIIGLVLLFAFYIILYTINPDILSGSSGTTISSSEESTAEETQEEIKPQQSGDFVLIGTGATLDNYDSIPLSSELLSKDGVYIDKETADKLVILAAEQDLGNWAVTEACTEISNGKCITTIDHQSICHSLGTCVDIGYGSAPVESVQTSFINAANQAGFDVIDEYTNNTKLWCSTSGSGFHLEINKSNCTNDSCWFCAST